MSQIKLKHSGGNSSIIAAPSSNPASDDMKTYRQALRDLPANTKDVYCPVSPTKPS